MTMTEDERAPRSLGTKMFTEDVAWVLGVKDAASIRSYANWSARKLRTARQADPAAVLDPGDFPLKDGEEPRTVRTAGGHERTTAASPYWYPATMAAYIPHRKGPGGRLMSEADRGACAGRLEAWLAGKGPES